MPQQQTIRYLSKWFGLACATFLMLQAGLQYAFSVYGESLSERLSLSNGQFETLGAVANAGGYASIFSGLFFDKIKGTRRFASFFCALIAATFFVAGFGGLYLAAQGVFSAPLWLLAALAFLANNGGTWVETATTTIVVSNFETERGPVMGILKAFVGLSASVYTTLYMTFCSKPIDFLLLLAIVPAALTLVASLGVQIVPFRQFEPTTKAYAFHMAINATIALTLFQLVVSMYFSTHQAHGGPGWVFCIACICLIMPIVALPKVFGGWRATPIPEDEQMALEEESAGNREANQSPDTEGGEDDGVTAPLLAHGTDSHVSARAQRRWQLLRIVAHFQHARVRHQKGDTYLITDSMQSYTLGECLRKLNFWLFTFAVATCTGVSLAFNNNLHPLSQALGGGKTATNVAVSVFSVANAFGRLSIAFVPEEVPRFGLLPRTHVLFAGCVATGLTAALDAVSTISMLPYTSVFTGYVFGFMQSLTPTVTSELFGLRHFASNYAFINTMFIAGSFGIAKGITNWSNSIFKSEGESQCHGQLCFGFAFWVCAALCLVAAAAVALLGYRTQGFYKRMGDVMRQERKKRGYEAHQKNRQDALDQLHNAIGTAREDMSSSLHHVGTLRLRLDKSSGGAGAAFDPETPRKGPAVSGGSPGGKLDASSDISSPGGQRNLERSLSVSDEVAAVEKRLKHGLKVLEAQAEPLAEAGETADGEEQQQQQGRSGTREGEAREASGAARSARRTDNGNSDNSGGHTESV